MPDDLVVDFVFVPNGAPFPHDWVRRHPDYISLSAHFKGTPAQFRRFMGRRAVALRDRIDKSDPQSAVGIIATAEAVTNSERAPNADRIGPDWNLPVHEAPPNVG